MFIYYLCKKNKKKTKLEREILEGICQVVKLCLPLWGRIAGDISLCSFLHILNVLYLL